MTVNGNSSLLGMGNEILSSYQDLKSTFDKLSQKMSSGQNAQTYAELGKDIIPALRLDDHISRLDSYSNSISSAKLNISLLSQSVSAVGKTIDAALKDQLNINGGTDQAARAVLRSGIEGHFTSLLSYLNVETGNGYGFGTGPNGEAPVLSANAIMDGANGRAGLKTLIAERYNADSGTNNLGRLSLSAIGSTVTIGEESAALPFGLKLAAITSTSSNTAVTQPSGSPATETIAFTGQPNAGYTVKFSFNLPDGSLSEIKLVAATSAGPGNFVIGAMPDETAQNLNAALSGAIQKLVGTDLQAASAISTAKDFFASTADNPPKRVSGTPPETATSLVAGTADNTIIWYRGKSAASDPRADQNLTISDDIAVKYGARANEEGFRNTLAGMAAMLAISSNFSTDESTAAAQATAIRSRSGDLLRTGKIGVNTIQVSIDMSLTSIKDVSDMHNSVKSLLQTNLGKILSTDTTSAAASIAFLTTQLQASAQVLSKVLNTNLINFIQ